VLITYPDIALVEGKGLVRRLTRHQHQEGLVQGEALWAMGSTAFMEFGKREREARERDKRLRILCTPHEQPLGYARGVSWCLTRHQHREGLVQGEPLNPSSSSLLSSLELSDTEVYEPLMRALIGLINRQQHEKGSFKVNP